jgi:squalene-associated FAD-dependent desaturase
MQVLQEMSTQSADTAPQTVIVGGGLAGLATAVGLGLHGRRVVLLESRPRWGGRATSIVDQTTGETIDNCQHVAMGCCTNFAHFCETVGIADCFRTEPMLWFIGPKGEQSRFAAGPWPAPLHLAGAFAGLKHLSWRDRWQLAWGLRALARLRPDGTETATFAEWLAKHGQSPRVCDRFWNVVLVSALSETLDRVNIAAARKVFVDGFLAHRKAWEVSIPTAPLGDLYGTAVQQWMEASGIETRMSAGVQSVEMTEGRVSGVVLRNGERIAAERVVLAVPSQLVAGLLPEAERGRAEFARLEQMEWAPISSAHFWLDREAIPLPHAALVGYRSQWVFNRTRLQGTPISEGTGWSYQVVISASRELDGENREAVLDGIVEELARIWPGVREARVLHRRLITEHRAALSMLPGVESLRPVQRTSIPGLYLAGDYTRTGWPSTMEGAVRSGYLAAEAILADTGHDAQVVRPDLPVGAWARVLMGL